MFFDLLLPQRCASCDVFARALLCEACEANIEWIDTGCTRCAAPVAPGGACRECAARPHVFARAAAAAIYTGPVRDAIVAFKLRGERRAARTFAGWLLGPASWLPRPDAVTWVPGTQKATVDRGFVPAGEIARAFAGLVRLRARPLLEKVRETTDQHGLAAGERAANLRGAFRARPCAGAILLVDDVLTTGATADACAEALTLGGAAAVSVLVVARAPLRKANAANSPFPRPPRRARMEPDGPSGSVVAAGGASRSLSRCQWQAKRPT